MDDLFVEFQLGEPNGTRLLVVGEHAVLGVEDFFEQQHEELFPYAARVFRFFAVELHLQP